MRPLLQIGIIAGKDVDNFEKNSVSLLSDLNSVSNVIDLTIILVDDSGIDSRDLTAIFSEFSLGKVRLKVVKHSLASGRPTARNSVLENVEIGQKKFLTWLDVDDIWLQGRANKILDFIRTATDFREIQVLGFETHWESGQKRRTMPSKHFGDYSALFSGYTPCYLWSMTFSTEIVRHLRFDVKLPRLQDLDFVLQAMRLGVYFRRQTGEPTIIYRKTDAHVNCRQLAKCYWYVLEKHRLEYEKMSRRQRLATEVNIKQLYLRCSGGKGRWNLLPQISCNITLTLKKIELATRATLISLFQTGVTLGSTTLSTVRKFPSRIRLMMRM